MFAPTTKAVVKALGAHRELIPNKNAYGKIGTLDLVKVHYGKFKTNYSINNKTLLDLLEEADVCPSVCSDLEHTDDVLMDFTKVKSIHAEGCVGANVKAAGEISAELSAGVDTVDAVSSFTLKKKTVDLHRLTELCNDKKIKQKLINELKLGKKEKLTFVHEIIYNTNPVTFVGINQQAASVFAEILDFFKARISGNRKQLTSFILPQNTTFAYRLMDIETDDGILRIPSKWQNRSGLVECVGAVADNSCEILQEVNKGVEKKEYVLQWLADLPESFHHDLLNELKELLKDRCALTLLEETWDQDSTADSDCPQSVSSFVELLKSSNTSTCQKDAVHLLISAMDTLPDDGPALLTSCSPDALRVLNQLVDSLKEDGQTKLPESLPPPLQEEGELRWVLELLCSSGDALTELSDQWDTPELTLTELLEALCLVIRGLSLIHLKTNS